MINYEFSTPEELGRGNIKTDNYKNPSKHFTILLVGTHIFW